MEVQGPPARRRPGPSLLRKACRAALGGGALALLEASALPVAAKTVVASCCAALWRIFIFPFDTVKTTLQVSGGAALRAKIAAGGLFSLYGGALGASFATLVGHYPWFATNNVLEGAVPDFGPRLKLARRAPRSSRRGASGACSGRACRRSCSATGSRPSSSPWPGRASWSATRRRTRRSA